jgi:hypothetical protein
MSFLTSLRLFTAASAIAVVASCGGKDETTTDEGLLFQGEGKLLEGFTFNTGPQPPSGPATLSLRLSGGGAVKVSARGAVEGSKLTGRAQSGKVEIDAHVKMDGTLKIDTSVKKSSGDIPGLKDIDIPITGTAAFDPFLLEGGSAEVTAAIPETNLPDIPLGSVPGKLKLTIVAGSQLTSKYEATCMTIASGAAQYAGHAITSGTLVIKGTIVLELPSPLNKEIELPEMKVTIPSATSEVVFASVATNGAEDSVTGSCGPIGEDGGVDGEIVDSGSPDTTVVDDTGSGFDTSTFDSGSFETSPTDSSTTDTSTGTTCTGDMFEPADNSAATARILPKITDCDGMEATVSGILSTTADVDTLRFEGDDTFGCAVNPYAKVTGPVRVCMAVSCISGTTDFKGCSKGTRTGNECCGTGEIEADVGCNGSANDSARVTLTVRSYSTLPACTSYSLRYHF